MAWGVNGLWTGITGIIGIIGITGKTGIIGKTGIAGIIGITGITGITGIWGFGDYLKYGDGIWIRRVVKIAWKCVLYAEEMKSCFEAFGTLA